MGSVFVLGFLTGFSVATTGWLILRAWLHQYSPWVEQANIAQPDDAIGREEND